MFGENFWWKFSVNFRVPRIIVLGVECLLINKKKKLDMLKIYIIYKREYVVEAFYLISGETCGLVVLKGCMFYLKIEFDL